MGSPRSLPLLLLLVLPTVAGGCLSTPTKYDPELHGPLEAGVTNTGGAGGRGSPGTGGTAGKADGPKIPVGAEGCTAQAPCTVLGQPCIVGTTICASDGTSTCGETAKLQANGSSCGVGDSVCLDGVCSACKPGSECALESQPCRRGAIDCGSGRPECIDMGNAPNGTECGQGMVCKDGTCSLCAAGDSCVPSNPCHEGMLECAAGTASCRDTGRPKAAGSSCGTDRVCGANGVCVACSMGKACELPDEPCRAGRDRVRRWRCDVRRLRERAQRKGLWIWSGLSRWILRGLQRGHELLAGQQMSCWKFVMCQRHPGVFG